MGRLKGLSRVVTVLRLRVVNTAHHDDAAGAAYDVSDIGAAVGVARHPRHLARVAAREPLVEKGQLGKTVGGSDAAQIKAKFNRLGFDPGSIHGERRGPSRSAKPVA